MPPRGSPSRSPRGKAKNKAITSFFKPAPNQQAQAPQPLRTSVTSPAFRASPKASSSSPELPKVTLGSPAGNGALAKKELVIAASDEDDDDDSDSSDGGFMDLMSTFDPKRAAAVERPSHSFTETPRAKRTMNTSHSSPLTINTKPHFMFDMRALARDAKIDDATKASSVQLQELVAQGQAKETERSLDFGSTLKDIVLDQGGQNAHKVMRAVQRVGEESLPQFYFFEANSKPPAPTVISKEAKEGPWKLLFHENIHTREQYLASGLPYTILQRKKELPTEIFEWILDDLCTQKSRLTQQEYCGIIDCCHTQTRFLVTPDRLQQLFKRLGASEGALVQGGELAVTRRVDKQYQERDWSSLQYFLKVLARMSKYLSLDAISYAAGTLFRLSMDRFLICNIEILMEFEVTLKHLLDAIPAANWSSFCLESSKALQKGFKSQNIRLNALLSFPISNRRAHELRRRLAICFLFDDADLGGQNPDDIITIRRLIDRLAKDDFTINSKTDFDEFRARIIILDIVIDDGSFAATGNKDEETNFNSDVDELAGRLREFWTKINDTGLKLARAQTKSVVEWVQKRLLVSVRTRKKAKKDIYDTAMLRDDPFLPRQQTMMKEFLGKKVRD